MTDKLDRLRSLIGDMGSVLVAYSGGVDSTFLIKVAKDAVHSAAVAVTAQSPTYPVHEMERAKSLAVHLGVRHLIIKTDELADKRFVSNPPDRCFWCKKALFEEMLRVAKRLHIDYVLDGSNYDDIRDFRPGMRAAEQLGIRSPLKEVGLTKHEIRSLSKTLGLPTWDLPSAACLASRFPYGTKITIENLRRVEEAERFLSQLGFTQVRVRHHGSTARIEVLEDAIPMLLDHNVRRQLVSELKNLGYTYVTIDLEGYRTGSLNESLEVLDDRSEG